MKKITLLLLLTFFELIICLIIYSFNEGFWHEIKINWVDFSIEQSDFNFFNFLSMSIYWFLTSILMESFKVFLLYNLVIIIFNMLVLNKILLSNVYLTIIFFVMSFLTLSYIFDSNFYQYENLNETINSILSIIITSIFISKITNKIIMISNK